MGLAEITFGNTFLDAVEQSSEKIAEGFDAALFDPPYNTPMIASSAYLRKERLDLKDMSVLVEMLSVLMAPWAHGHMCCSALQFETWYRLWK